MPSVRHHRHWHCNTPANPACKALKVFECRIPCQTPRGSCRCHVYRGNFMKSCQLWPSSLAKDSICIQTEECNYSSNLWSNTSPAPAGPPSSLAPSLNIITHIKSKHCRSGHLLSAPAVFVCGKILHVSVWRELMVKTCSSHLGCPAVNDTEGLAFCVRKNRSSTVRFVFGLEQPLQHLPWSVVIISTQICFRPLAIHITRISSCFGH